MTSLRRSKRIAARRREKCAIKNLPVDIFYDIIRSLHIPHGASMRCSFPKIHAQNCYIGARRTLANLCLVSKSFKSIAEPLLYAEFFWQQQPEKLCITDTPLIESLSSFTTAVLRQPHLADYVKSVHISFLYPSSIEGETRLPLLSHVQRQLLETPDRSILVFEPHPDHMFFDCYTMSFLGLFPNLRSVDIGLTYDNLARLMLHIKRSPHLREAHIWFNYGLRMFEQTWLKIEKRDSSVGVHSEENPKYELTIAGLTAEQTRRFIESMAGETVCAINLLALRRETCSQYESLMDRISIFHHYLESLQFWYTKLEYQPARYSFKELPVLKSLKLGSAMVEACAKALEGLDPLGGSDPLEGLDPWAHLLPRTLKRLILHGKMTASRLLQLSAAVGRGELPELKYVEMEHNWLDAQFWHPVINVDDDVIQAMREVGIEFKAGEEPPEGAEPGVKLRPKC